MAYDTLVKLLAMAYKPPSCRLLVNSAMIHAVLPDGVDGVHLTTDDLYGYQQKPHLQQLLTAQKTIGASCHNGHDLQQADLAKVDFVTLSPVYQTRTHPQAQPLGWRQFAAFTASTKIPVYALGGMQPQDAAHARTLGAAGVAGIRGFWNKRPDDTIATP